MTGAAGDLTMYLDTAIIIKLLVAEPDSAFFESSLIGQSLSTSELAWTEVWSALLGKERSRQLSTKQRKAAWQQFTKLVENEQIRLYPLETPTLKRANRLLEANHPKVPLRTLDAIHLAASDLSQDFPLCTTDRRLRDAALLLQIPVFPEEEE